MDIRSVHAYLVTLLGSLEIAQPRKMKLKRVYKFVPPSREAITDLPCAFSTYVQEPIQFGPAIMHKPYSINVQLLAGRSSAEADMSSDIASAFLEAFIQAVSKSQRLGGTVSVVNGLRGQSPQTLTVLDWAGQGYVGLDLFLDVTISEKAEHAA